MSKPPTRTPAENVTQLPVNTAPGTAVAVAGVPTEGVVGGYTDNSAFMIPDDLQPAVLRRVTVPVLSLKFDKVNPRPIRFACRIITAIETSKIAEERTQGRGTTTVMEDADVCQIEGYNGDVRQLVTGKVLAEELRRNYPDDGYVGRWFCIVKYPPAPDKRYSLYEVAEIHPPQVKEKIAATSAA